jgi:hypothetical protein
VPEGHAQTEVLTRSYENNRTGANLTEKVLSPQKVRALGLKRRFKIELKQDDHRSRRRAVDSADMAISTQLTRCRSRLMLVT